MKSTNIHPCSVYDFFWGGLKYEKLHYGLKGCLQSRGCCRYTGFILIVLLKVRGGILVFVRYPYRIKQVPISMSGYWVAPGWNLTITWINFEIAISRGRKKALTWASEAQKNAVIEMHE